MATRSHEQRSGARWPAADVQTSANVGGPGRTRASSDDSPAYEDIVTEDVGREDLGEALWRARLLLDDDLAAGFEHVRDLATQDVT